MPTRRGSHSFFARRTYVNETFAKCTDANRAAVETELKELVFKAFEADKLWTIDWASVKLVAYAPALLRPSRRRDEHPGLTHPFDSHRLNPPKKRK